MMHVNIIAKLVHKALISVELVQEIEQIYQIVIARMVLMIHKVQVALLVLFHAKIVLHLLIIVLLVWIVTHLELGTRAHVLMDIMMMVVQTHANNVHFHVKIVLLLMIVPLAKVVPLPELVILVPVLTNITMMEVQHLV